MKAFSFLCCSCFTKTERERESGPQSGVVLQDEGLRKCVGFSNLFSTFLFFGAKCLFLLRGPFFFRPNMQLLLRLLPLAVVLRPSSCQADDTDGEERKLPDDDDQL